MADDTAAEQPSGLPAHLRDDLKWKPGQSGNPGGRPKGARSKLSEAFLEALLEDFEKASEEDASLGAKAIAAMRAEKPNEYARMIASILAKEVDANLNGDISDEMKRWLGIG
jgi:hypothetical protein